jgi:hypothetical protein
LRKKKSCLYNFSSALVFFINGNKIEIMSKLVNAELISYCCCSWTLKKTAIVCGMLVKWLVGSESGWLYFLILIDCFSRKASVMRNYLWSFFSFLDTLDSKRQIMSVNCLRIVLHCLTKVTFLTFALVSIICNINIQKSSILFFNNRFNIPKLVH